MNPYQPGEDNQDPYTVGFQAGAASRDAEVARLKTVPMRYRRMALNAQLQDEVARLEQENDQLRAQIKQKDVGIAELVTALEHILAGSLSLPRFAEAEAIAVIAKVRNQ